MNNQNKIKNILDSLNKLQEELLALPDDILLGIDPRDNESLNEGYKFLTSYNEHIATFSTNMINVAELLKAYFAIDPEKEEEESNLGNNQKCNRIIKELDKTQAHSLDESYTYKRPFGFILEERALKGLKTWKSLYIHVLNFLHEKDPMLYKNTLNEKKFISSRNNLSFSLDPSDLRVAEKIPGDFFAEINLSANGIIKNITALLKSFKIPYEEMKIFLREDRDAIKDNSSNK